MHVEALKGSGDSHAWRRPTVRKFRRVFPQTYERGRLSISAHHVEGLDTGHICHKPASVEREDTARTNEAGSGEPDMNANTCADARACLGPPHELGAGAVAQAVNGAACTG